MFLFKTAPRFAFGELKLSSKTCLIQLQFMTVPECESKPVAVLLIFMYLSDAALQALVE